MTSFDTTQFIQRLEEHQRKFRAAIERAVYKFSAHVLGEAQELCPVSSVPGHAGTLKSSDQQDEVQTTDGLVTCQIGFTEFYAVFVHEILTNAHPQGQAKFLETAMKANVSRFMEFVQEELAAEGLT